jgi:FAD/FMN-containing dehydrogenase
MPPTPPPLLDGELRFDEARRNGRVDDFGHIGHKVPASRHPTFGRAQVPSGIVADISTLRYVGPVEGDRVVVEGGATWSDVLRATLPQGKTPPVLTDYLELSVGGTLIVGGVGVASNNVDLFNAVRAGLG